MARKKVLFYCQHLLGVGHISRSLAICRALLSTFDVDFVQGGPDIGRTLTATGFRQILLPPLLMREHDSSLYDPVADRPVEEIWKARWEVLSREVLPGRYDAVIVELFPFGRNKFKPEIFGLIDAIRATNPAARTYCSNRDIMVRKPDQAKREAKIVRILDQYFDTLLVHTDPSVIALDDTFGATDQVRDRLLYTGYVTDTSGLPDVPPARGPQILVSQGGGAVGSQLGPAVAEITDRFPEYKFRFLTGPYSAKDSIEAIRRRTAGQDNVTIEGFSDNFRNNLAASSLSISLAGYNTLMDILSTRTPALLYPYMANIEQNMRASIVAERGLIGLLYDETLAPDRLAQAIRDRLGAPLPETTIDLSGAETTARILRDQLG